MRHVYSLLLGCLFFLFASAQQPNDHIFPAAAAARASIKDFRGMRLNLDESRILSCGLCHKGCIIKKLLSSLFRQAIVFYDTLFSGDLLNTAFRDN